MSMKDVLIFRHSKMKAKEKNTKDMQCKQQALKKSQLAILIPDKVDSKKRSITSDRETT